MKNKFTIPVYIKYLLYIYLLGILFLTSARLFLLVQHLNALTGVPVKIVLQSFWMGFRFDTVVSGYILVAPFIIFTISSLLKNRYRPLINFGAIVLTIEYIVLFFISAADIPYFNHYNSRITISALTWTDSPLFVVNMIAQDETYYLYILIFIIWAGLAVFLFHKAKERYFRSGIQILHQENKSYYLTNMVCFFIAIPVMFFAIRGRAEIKSPIRWGTAFFSNYALPNQMALNPAFTFFQSYLDSKNPKNCTLHLMNPDEALNIVREDLKIKNMGYDSPLARLVKAKTGMTNKNVVLVLMESMAAWKMEHFGNNEKLTPFLDSLAGAGYLFTNFYSSGIHTYCGIYSTLFSYPVLLTHHPMKSVESMQPYGSIALTLRANNYQTIFFTTHDAQFDNMGGFLSNNGFNTIVSQKDYPAEKVKSTLGVPDGDLFDLSIPYLNKLAAGNKPFFAAMLTASDHGPYVIPKVPGFKPKSKTEMKQIIEYADWAIEQFIIKAKQQPWFKNTIFVFTADHGAIDNPVYDMDLSFNHTPLVIYYDGIIPKRYEVLGGQVDVAPTILSMLNISYVNNTMGVDLLSAKRDYCYFNADEKIGCIDKDYYLIIRQDGSFSLYRFKERANNDYSQLQPAKANEMKKKALAYYQTAQWMISNKKVKPL
ncbi:MAG: sulfatase-like hydrolase/transferase [Bacteroidota bacterium]|nr:sulfatase-like hydrolase/transferase [Bacteroidota bacterium]